MCTFALASFVSFALVQRRYMGFETLVVYANR